jgi:hypothetical protein
VEAFWGAENGIKKINFSVHVDCAFFMALAGNFRYS